jgi:ABC-type branched-subunit amino acid transport system substrate-binding protein
MIAGTTSFDAQLLQTQQQKADYIFLQNVPTQPSILGKDVKRLGIKAKLVLLNWTANELFVRLAGEAAAEGALAVQPFAPVSYNVPGMKVPEQYLKAHGSSLAKEGIQYLRGWYTAALLAESINRLIKKNQAVTGPKIKNALETMPAFPTGGVTFPIKFGPVGNVAHDGMKGSRIYTIKGGRFVKTTGFMLL